MFDKLTGVLFPPVLPLYFPQPFRSPSRGSFHAFPGLKFYFLSGFLKFFIFFQITCCNFQDFCYNSFCSGVWRSLVARTAGGREVAGSNPVTPIPWQGHGRRSDPSGGLRKRETVYCGVSFLCNRKLRFHFHRIRRF